MVLVGTALPGCLNSDDAEKPATGTAGAPAEPIQAKTEGANVRVPGGGNLKPNTAIAFTYGPKDNPKPGIVFATASGQLKALSARCTHAGCAVNWSDEGNSHLHCPCHGSNFDLTGKVLQGPAKAPLATFAVQKSGNDALVTPAA